jgi:hypothetical protein
MIKKGWGEHIKKGWGEHFVVVFGRSRNGATGTMGGEYSD